MAMAALEVFHDSNRAIADKLSSQDGANSWANRGDRHKASIGAHVSNDLVESNFGCVKYVMRAFRGISIEAASGIAQQMRHGDFNPASRVVHDRCRLPPPAASPASPPPPLTPSRALPLQKEGQGRADRAPGRLF